MKSTEKPHCSKQTFESLSNFVYSDESCSNESQASEAFEEEVFALTTIKNFRTDDIDEFAVESDWVFATREELEEPRYQQRLAKSEVMTRLCKSIADSSIYKRTAVVVATPPKCHCKELSSLEDSPKTKKGNVFYRFFKAIKTFFCGVCRRFKCKFCVKKTNKNILEVRELITSDRTASYLCR